MTAAGRSALPAVVGHRGAAAYAPENTLAGFRMAAKRGARWVELDAQPSADGHLAVIHDSTLDRTTDGHGPVIGRTMADLARLDAGGWFGASFGGEPVPTLEQALRLIAALGIGVNVELKGDPGRARDAAIAAAGALAAAWPAAAPPPLVSSFDHGYLEALRAVAPHLRRGMLVARLAGDWATRARALDVVSVHVGQGALDRPSVEQVKAAGFALAAYTVNDTDRARTLYGWGVDALFTDRPDVIARSL